MATLDPSAYISTVTNRAFDDWGKSQEQYDWAKKQFAKNEKTSDTVVGRALDTGADFGNWAKADRAQYERNVVPAMDQQMDFARGYASDARMKSNRAAAIGGANMASDMARAQAEQSLQSYGVDPAAGRFAGLDAGLAAKKAATAASAGTQSDRQTEMLGQEYLNNAIKTGQVLPGQVANEANVGLASGNQAVNAGLATTASGSATMGTPIQWSSLGNDMIKQWEGAQKDAADVSLANEKLAQSNSSGIGAALGAGAGILGGIAKIAPMFMAAKRGGMIRKFRAGGPVTPHIPDDFVEEEPGTIEEEDDPVDEGQQQGDPDFVPSLDIPIRHEAKYAEGGEVTPEVMSPEERELYERHWQTINSYADGGAATRGFAEDIIEGDDPTQAGAAATDPSSLLGPVGSLIAGKGIGETAGPVGRLFMAGGGEPQDQGANPNSVPPSASPSAGAETDDVPAMLNEGEFVMPKDVASWYGEKYLQGLIEKARRDMQNVTAKPEMATVPQAMALQPPAFRSEGARQ